MNQADWQLSYDELATGVRSYGQESLLTLGNGYLGWRGAPVMATYGDDHYPGLYVAGVFNQTSTPIAGKDVINEDMVNLPNPQLIEIDVDGEVVAFRPRTRRAVLHMDNGSLEERYTFNLAKGNLIVETQKIVNPARMHQLGLRITLATTFAATVTVRAIVDGSVTNQNVKRYRDFDSQEFDVLGISDNLLIAQTRQSKIDLVVGAKTTSEQTTFKSYGETGLLIQEGSFKVSAGTPVTIDRVMTVATSYEENDPQGVAAAELADADFDHMLVEVATYWRNVWRTADVILESDDADLQRMVRLNIFHIRQAAQHQANKHLDASVGSRGLTGEGYRGHIFWDEIFVVPYYAANDPETAKDILQYRIKRLGAAQKNALVDGEVGAMYPWQSGMTGDEQSQVIHLNTVNNEWEPDNSRLQRHVSLAVVYNMWIYTQLTGDYSLLQDGGLEILLETSKFWLNKVELGEDGRYHLAGVMGPDEYHEAYPDATTGGVKDNAYTNLMLAWSLNWLQELAESGAAGSVPTELLAQAQEVGTKLALEVADDGVIAQYAGYFDLQPVDFTAYAEKYGDIHRIDRLMKAEGLSPDDYQVAKQADTLMTIYNLGAAHMARLVAQLGYELPENWLQVNKDYYLARTVHGSTTSRPVFAGIDVTLGNTKEALDYLITAIGSDYYDIQGGTTAEGVHIGVMGETLEVIQNEFGGVSLRDGQVLVAPKLPDTWSRLAFSQRFRGVQLSFDVTPDQVTVTADAAIDITIYDQTVQLAAHTPVAVSTKG
jgi:trehalose 6-phosphate phosphorylase